jgi:hypothetical protein
MSIDRFMQIKDFLYASKVLPEKFFFNKIYLTGNVLLLNIRCKIQTS